MKYTSEDDFKWIVSDNGTVTITGYNKDTDGVDLVIPATIDGKRVESIGNSAFYMTKSVTIPENIKGAWF